MNTMTSTNTDTIEIYLGKNGETFGPYTAEQFEAMKAAPDFASYTYIWDGREEGAQWKAIEKAPAAAPAAKRGPGAPPPDARPAPQQAQPAPAPEPAPAPARRPVLKGYDVPGLEALCHDSRAVITGKLVSVTDAGCELVSRQRASEPVFGAQANVTLNLLEPRSGRSQNVAARLDGVRRKDGAWTYRIQWQGCPELVVQQLEKAA